MKKILALIAVAGSVSICQAQQTVTLSSINEPTVNYDTYIYGTTASAQFSLSGSTLSITGGSFSLLWGDPTSIAVGDGSVGTVGTAAIGLLSENITSESGNLYDGTFSGTVPLTTGQIADYYADDLYVNISTTSESSPQGEVRGQLAPVPEPATMTLMALGSAAWLAKRRKKV